MKLFLLTLTFLSSVTTFAANDFTCFTTYTNSQLGMVQEKTFQINKRDQRIISDGYITSINLDDLATDGKAEIELNYGVGVLNKNKILKLAFKPMLAVHPHTQEKKLTRVGISINDLNLSVDLIENSTSVITFPANFNGEEKRVSLECGLINL